jgi:hypothetical protein
MCAILRPNVIQITSNNLFFRSAPDQTGKTLKELYLIE